VSIRLHLRPRRAAIAMLLSVCALGAGHLSAAPSQEDSRKAKIAELIRLRGLAGMLEQSKAAGLDQDDAVLAWGRFYSQGLTDQELDAILAYYRSPLGQKDVRASQAALPQFQKYLIEKQTAARNIPVAPRGIADPAKAAAPQPDTSPLRRSGFGSEPSVPDGKVVANSVSDRCEAAPTAAPQARNTPATGRSVLCVCVDEKGKLTQEPVITESSGDARVDTGAVKLARVNSGRYTPPSVDGKPQMGCFRYAVNFRHPE
jgi:hypothetical protein